MLRHVSWKSMKISHLPQNPFQEYWVENDFPCNFEGFQYNQVQYTAVLYRNYLKILRDIYCSFL